MLAVILLCGCASLAESEQRQLSYTGDRGWFQNPCLFGGVTPQAGEHCAELGPGIDSLIAAANQRVLAQTSHGGMLCTDHVAALRKQLAVYASLNLRDIYSCPHYDPVLNQCHVSLMITDANGMEYVADNGAVLRSPSRLASLHEFTESVHGRYWLDDVPSVYEILAFDPSHHSFTDLPTVWSGP